MQVSTGPGYKDEIGSPDWSWNRNYDENRKYTALTPCCSIAGHPAYMAMDGDENTFWRSAQTTSGYEELTLVLQGGGAYVSRLEVLWGIDEHASSYNISVSSDDKTFNQVYAETNGAGGVEQISWLDASAQKIKHIKMRLLAPAFPGATYSVREFRASGCTGQSDASTFTASQKVSAVASRTPTVASVTPSKGTTAGGSDVTIRGNFFGADIQLLKVKFGDFACALKSVAKEGGTDVSTKTKLTCASSGFEIFFDEHSCV